jgi:hypothetical protein
LLLFTGGWRKDKNEEEIFKLHGERKETGFLNQIFQKPHPAFKNFRRNSMLFLNPSTILSNYFTNKSCIK